MPMLCIFSHMGVWLSGSLLSELCCPCLITVAAAATDAALFPWIVALLRTFGSGRFASVYCEHSVAAHFRGFASGVQSVHVAA